jgi:hypothetical protein
MLTSDKGLTLRLHAQLASSVGRTLPVLLFHRFHIISCGESLPQSKSLRRINHLHLILLRPTLHIRQPVASIGPPVEPLAWLARLDQSTPLHAVQVLPTILGVREAPRAIWRALGLDRFRPRCTIRRHLAVLPVNFDATAFLFCSTNHHKNKHLGSEVGSNKKRFVCKHAD